MGREGGGHLWAPRDPLGAPTDSPRPTQGTLACGGATQRPSQGTLVLGGAPKDLPRAPTDPPITPGAPTDPPPTARALSDPPRAPINHVRLTCAPPRGPLDPPSSPRAPPDPPGHPKPLPRHTPPPVKLNPSKGGVVSAPHGPPTGLGTPRGGMSVCPSWGPCGRWGHVSVCPSWGVPGGGGEGPTSFCPCADSWLFLSGCAWAPPLHVPPPALALCPSPVSRAGPCGSRSRPFSVGKCRGGSAPPHPPPRQCVCVLSPSTPTQA